MSISIDEEHCSKDDSILYYPNLRSCLSVTLVFGAALVGTHLTTGTKSHYGATIFEKMVDLKQGEGNLLSIFLIGNVAQFTHNRNEGTGSMRLPKKLLKTLKHYFGIARVLAYDSVAAHGESNAVKLELVGTSAPLSDCTPAGTYTTPRLNVVPDGLFKLRRLDENPSMYKPPTAVGFALNTNQRFTPIKPSDYTRLV